MVGSLVRLARLGTLIIALTSPRAAPDYITCPCSHVGAYSAACDHQCQGKQRQALERLYHAWNGARWHQKQGWLSDIHHCSWHGVSCCPGNGSYLAKPEWHDVQTEWELIELSKCCCANPGAVSSLQLPSNNLSGQLSAFAAAQELFSTLLVINLQNNSLQGTWPGTVSGLRVLHGLYLSFNALQGSVPASVGNLSYLKVLSAAANLLTGILPAVDLLQLQHLETLVLDNNRLIGTVPLELLQLPTIKRLQVSNNQFSGQLVLPQQLAAASTAQDTETTYAYRLRVFDIEHNQVSGSLPPSLLEMIELSVDLSSNKFNGTLPAVKNKALRTLRLANNHLSGTLPVEFGAQNLLELDISGNMLEGALPAWLTRMSDLVVLRVNANNGLVGTLPEALVAQQHLALLDGRGTSMQQPKYAPSGTDDAMITAIPAWMQLHMIAYSGSAATSNMSGTPNCPYPSVKGKDSLLRLDPYYFQYEGCQCPSGDKVFTSAANSSAVTRLQCEIATHEQATEVWKLLLYILLPILSVALVVSLAVPTYAYMRMKGKSATDLLSVKKKRARPPEEGQPLTLVLTDVADSTALWEWDTVQASQAIDQHDKILRDYLSTFCGYEITTEGDAFLVAFHEPGDAIAYCLTVQIALQYADWSKNVLQWCQQRLPPPSKTAVALADAAVSRNNAGAVTEQHTVRVRAAEAETSSSDGTDCTETQQKQSVPSLPSAAELFRGLRVRMAVATGIADGVKLHKVTGRVEYWGQVMQKVQALAEAPEGGQVLMDSETFRGINTRLPQKGARVMAALAAKGCLLPAAKASELDGHPRRAPVSGDAIEHSMGSTVALALVQQEQRNSAVCTPPHSPRLPTVALPGSEVPREQDMSPARQFKPNSTFAEWHSSVMTDTPDDWVISSKQAVHACPASQQVQLGSSNSSFMAGQPSTNGYDSQPASGSLPSLTAAQMQDMSFSGLLAASGASFTAAVKQGPTNSCKARPGSFEYSNGFSKQRGSHLACGASQADYFLPQQHLSSEVWLASDLYGNARNNQCSTLKQPTASTSQEHHMVCHVQSPGSSLSSKAGYKAGTTGTDMPQAQQEQQSTSLSGCGSILSSVPTFDNTGLLLRQIELHQLGGLDQQQLGMSTDAQMQHNKPLSSQPEFVNNLLKLGDADDSGEQDLEGVQLSGESRTLLQPSNNGFMLTAMGEAGAVDIQNSVAGSGSLGWGGQQQQHLPRVHTGDQLTVKQPSYGTQAQHCQHTDVPTPHRLTSNSGKVRSLFEWAMGSLLPSEHGQQVAGRRGHSIDPIWNSQNGTIQTKQPGGTAVMVLDMGIHKLSGHAEPVQLVVALPPGFEARANYHALLSTMQQQTPGYLDAPAASASPLGAEDPRKHGQLLRNRLGRVSVPRNMFKLPPVVMVFCAVDGYHDMLVSNRPAAEELLQQYSDVVRWTLLVAGGYECQEQEGNYMIAFDAADAALEWALLVQEALLEVTWSSQVLALPGAGEVVSRETGMIQFRGPRVRIGLYRGIPTRVVPHSTTGRADYFGPLVNRAARYCHTAAHAGQVVAARELVEELVQQWCSVDPASLPGNPGPPWTLQLQATPHDQARACWARCPQPRGASIRAGKSSLMMEHRASKDPSGCRAESVLMDEITTPAMACRAELRRSSGSLCSRRSRARFTDTQDSPPIAPVASLQRSLTLLNNADLPISVGPSSPNAANEGSTHGGLKLSHTPSMRRVLLVPQDCSQGSSPHPVPDLSSLVTLRKVAADQLQQQQEEAANSPPAGVTFTGVSDPAATSPASNGPQLKTSITMKRGSPSNRRTRTASNATYGARKMSGGFDLDSGLAAALYARLVLHRWKWADTLLIHDIGEYTFKGINGSHSLVSVTTKALAGRSFPQRLRKSKGEQITKGKGLLYELQVLATSEGQQVRQQDT